MSTSIARSPISIYRSADDGKTWLRVNSRAKVSITTLIAHKGELLAMGLDGLQLRTTDQEQRFSGSPRRDRAPLTAAAVRSDGALVRFSRSGVVTSAARGQAGTFN